MWNAHPYTNVILVRAAHSCTYAILCSFMCMCATDVYTHIKICPTSPFRYIYDILLIQYICATHSFSCVIIPSYLFRFICDTLPIHAQMCCSFIYKSDTSKLLIQIQTLHTSTNQGV